MPFDVRGGLCLAERRESGQFALVTIHYETECLGEKAVKIPQAMGRKRSVKTFIAAEKSLKPDPPGGAGAIGDVVAASVGRIDEAVVKRLIEVSRDAVGEMMIREIDSGLVEAVTSPKRVRIEDVERVADAQFLHHVGHVRQTFLAQQPECMLLQPQPSPQGIGLKFEVVARGADHVDISAPDAANRQTFVDGGDRQFLFGANARALLACQPFERNGRQQLIIAKQAGRRVVRTVVDAEQVHWGCRTGGWNEKPTAASTAPPRCLCLPLHQDSSTRAMRRRFGAREQRAMPIGATGPKAAGVMALQLA